MANGPANGRVLIAGGGIGGLTAALCLAKGGFEVALFEQAAEFGEIGAGIQLSPNCTRVLHHLGLKQRPGSLRLPARRHRVPGLEIRQGDWCLGVG